MSIFIGLQHVDISDFNILHRCMTTLDFYSRQFLLSNVKNMMQSNMMSALLFQLNTPKNGSNWMRTGSNRSVMKKSIAHELRSLSIPFEDRVLYTLVSVTVGRVYFLPSVPPVVFAFTCAPSDGKPLITFIFLWTRYHSVLPFVNGL